MNNIDLNNLNVSNFKTYPESEPKSDRVHAARFKIDRKRKANSEGDLSSKKGRVGLLEKKRKADHQLEGGQPPEKKSPKANSAQLTKDVYENVLLDKNIPADIRQRVDEELIKLKNESPISDLPLEMLASIFSFAPDEARSLRLVNSTFNSVTKNHEFLDAYHLRCLDVLKKRFIETGLSEVRFRSFIKIAIHRLKAADKKTSNDNCLRELIDFQKERLPSELFTEASVPVTLEEFVDREQIIKQYNTFLIAKKLFGSISSVKIPYENPCNRRQLENNYDYILNHLEGLRSIGNVDLENLGITEFPEEIASHLTNARVLKISNNRLSFISKKCLSKLPSLLQLWLNGNQLIELDNDTFSGLTNLQVLALNRNQLTALDTGIFSGLTKLRGLALSRNQLTTLDRGIFSGLTRLTELYLHGNQLTALDEGIFSGLTRLQTLQLNHNQLAALHKGIFSGLTRLAELYLNGNQLNTLDEGIFSGLTRLQKLALASNHLTALNKGTFSGLMNLQALALNGNHLTALDKGPFSGLTNLQRLRLDGNFLTALHGDTFSELINLQKLWLYDNQLTVLDKGTFSQLTNLRGLSLNGNRLTALDDGIFSGLTNLQILELKDNQLTALDKGIFLGLTNLKELRLFGNQVIRLDGDTLSELTHLQSLC